MPPLYNSRPGTGRGKHGERAPSAGKKTKEKEANTEAYKSNQDLLASCGPWQVLSLVQQSTHRESIPQNGVFHIINAEKAAIY